MKTRQFLREFLFPAVLLCTMSSCDFFSTGDESQGIISICFAEGSKTIIPDPDEFHLKVSDEEGNTVYEGSYGASPESIRVKAGNYVVKAISRDFSAPLFESPQYGDTQVVSVPGGETVKVTLNCAQTNAGIKVRYTPEFRSEYPSASFTLSSSDGMLAYSYLETRTAFFKPGKVRMVMNDKGVDRTLFTVTLEEREMLNVTVRSYSDDDGPAAPVNQTQASLQVVVDTLRKWVSSDVNISAGGSDGHDMDASDAWTVSKARSNPGSDDVWVQGYIVGGDLTTSKCSFEPPFTSRTNIVIAERSSCTDKSLCLSVQLAKGDVRDALNLVDHPELLGRKVCLKGDVVASYYGIPGLQGISSYILK